MVAEELEHVGGEAEGLPVEPLRHFVDILDGRFVLQIV